MKITRHSIELDGEMIRYQWRQDRRLKHFRIRIGSDGRLTVSSPPIFLASLMKRVLFRHKNWILSKIKEMQINQIGQANRYSRRDYLKYKEKARSLISERLIELNKQYGFSYNRVSIRDQKSRWGSCSSKGNLNFSYKILFLTPHLRDYIIVHELCHLQELNHSPRFWELVAKTFPDHKEIKNELKEYSIRLE